MTRDDIVSAAVAAIGTPFRHQGRVVGKGLDCAGLLYHVARSNGIEAIDAGGYPRSPNGELETTLAANVEAGVIYPVPVDNMQAGDMVLMSFESAPRHLGIIGHGGTLIHAYAAVRKVCEHRIDAQWQRRIIKAWRFAGVEA